MNVERKNMMTTEVKRKLTYKHMTFLAFCLSNVVLFNNNTCLADPNDTEGQDDDKGKITNIRPPADPNDNNEDYLKKNSSEKETTKKRKISDLSDSQKTTLYICSDSDTSEKKRVKFLKTELLLPTEIPYSGKTSAGLGFFAKEVSYNGTVQAHKSNDAKFTEIVDLIYTINEENEGLKKAFTAINEEKESLNKAVSTIKEEREKLTGQNEKLQQKVKKNKDKWKIIKDLANKNKQPNNESVSSVISPINSPGEIPPLTELIEGKKN